MTTLGATALGTIGGALDVFEQWVREYRDYPSEDFRRQRLDDIAEARRWVRAQR